MGFRPQFYGGNKNAPHSISSAERLRVPHASG